MTWETRTAQGNLVVLGDEEDQATKAGGLLASVTPDPQYEGNKRFELVQKDGESNIIAGCAAINRGINEGDVGKFVKLEFIGWGKSGRGKFKQIDVQVWDGEPTAKMKKWPRYDELNAKHEPKYEDFPEAADEDSDLPF